jgi:tetratricopeptide (TPR) repeat protein
MSRRSKKQPVSVKTTVVQAIHKSAAVAEVCDADRLAPATLAKPWKLAIVCVCLIVATMLVYMKAGTFSFIDYDDPAMVTENSHVKSGLTGENVAWAFTDVKLYYWHPLTYLSHMLDCQLFELNPGPPHVENAIYHALNAALLFLALAYLTRTFWPPVFVAALFALHPLRVESVAWITERRDVLCGLFSLLTLLAYAHYAARPASRKRYLLVFAAFCLAVMSKPMAITLPIVLLLLDQWPLKRFSRSGARALIVEKFPLFAVSGLSALLTVIGNAGSVISLDVLPFRERIGSAFAAYAAYLGKFFWPARLAVFYPHTSVAAWKLTLAGLVFVVLTALVTQNRRRRPYLFVGWWWFVVMLLPVIGIVQSGGQFIADRFTYLPLIGPVIAIVWFGAELLGKRPQWKTTAVITVAAVLIVLAGLSFRQTGFWSDKFTVYRHTLDVTSDNERMWYFYAKALATDGYLEQSEKAYREAIRLTPLRADDHEALGLLLAREGRMADAVREYREVISMEPENVPVLRYLALALIQSGSVGEALEYLRAAARIAPDDAQVRQLSSLAATMNPAAKAPDSPVPIGNVTAVEKAAAANAPVPFNWGYLSADEALQLGLLAGLLAVAVLWPRWGDGPFTRFEHFLARLSARPWHAMALVIAFPLVLRLLYLPIYPIPEPTIHDEFGYLLLGDTFASGRVTNPPHPMADHFESIYILQHPSYTSYYPFAPGLMLAPALFLGLNPWFAVCLSIGLMSAAFYWMLKGWMAPRWALLGALLGVARLGVLSHWMNSYWGGAVAAMGGALVFGALPRIFRGGGARYAVVLGIGLMILVQSRPYETLVMSIPVGLALMMWMLRSRKANLWPSLKRIALPLCAVLVCGAGLSVYYNWRVTGNPSQLPYQLYKKSYGMPQSFYWEAPLPPGNSIKYQDLYQLYQWQLNNYNVRNSWHALTGVTSQKLRALWAFYLQPVWTLPLLLVPWLWPQRRLRVLLWSIVFLLAGVAVYPFFFPHYVAPACGALLIVVMYGLRRMRLFEWRKRPVGLAFARAVVVVSAACLFIAPAGEYMMTTPRLVHKGTARQRILNTLEAHGGRHLIFVHYGPNHSFHNGVINNAANIDNSPVIWARDLGESKNHDLMRYYPDRTAWWFDADEWPVHLKSYGSSDRAAPAVAGR